MKSICKGASDQGTLVKILPHKNKHLFPSPSVSTLGILNYALQHHK